uniref:Retrovirus-related Pol polyprotein from transposon TNT 1-94 n=1 Tax=Tanacetum cinerariifolium TaxID=118510 RepID=A0A699J8J8_TANCI|nr:hypothetical protein [Tanacetum cinerariifolium]
MMLESIENGPLVHPTVKVDGLAHDLYALVNHCQSAKDIWERVKLPMKGTELSYQEREWHMVRQCTQPKRPRNAAWFKEKLMLAEAQESGQVLDEEKLAFLADPGITYCHDVQPTIIHNAAF